MTHSCGNCGRTFTTKGDLALHRDDCVADQLACRQCGGRFAESTATDDGWHYECPDADCDGAGIGEDLVHVDELRVGAP